MGTLLAITAIHSLISFIGDSSAGVPTAWPFLLGLLAFALEDIVFSTYLACFVLGAKLEPAFGWFTLAMGSFIPAKELLFHHG